MATNCWKETKELLGEIWEELQPYFVWMCPTVWLSLTDHIDELYYSQTNNYVLYIAL